MAKQDIRAGGTFVELTLKRQAFLKGLANASDRLKRMGKTFRNVGTRLARVGAAITAPFIAATAVFERTGDSLNKMAIRTGISVESLSQLQFAANRTGTSLQDVEKAVLRMNRRLGRLTAGQGSASERNALAALGFDAERLQKLSPEQRLLEIADAMSRFGDSSEAAGLAQRAFGTGVDKILPLLLEGRVGIRQLMEQADSLGLTIGSESAQAAANFSDALGTLKDQVKNAFFQVGAAVAGPLTKFFKTIQPVVKSVIEWVKNNKQLVATIAAIGAGLTAASTALIAFGFAVSGLGVALGIVASILGAILSPLGLLIAAVTTGTVAFFKFTDAGRSLGSTLANVFGDIGGIAKSTFGGIVDALKSGDIELAGEIAILGLKAVWERVLIEIRKLLNNDFVRGVIDAAISVKDFFIDIFQGLKDFWKSDFMKTLVGVFLDGVAAIAKGAVIVVNNIRSALAATRREAAQSSFDEAERQLQQRRVQIREEQTALTKTITEKAGGQVSLSIGERNRGVTIEDKLREAGIEEDLIQRRAQLVKAQQALRDKTLSNMQQLRAANEAVLGPAREEKRLLAEIDRIRQQGLQSSEGSAKSAGEERKRLDDLLRRLGERTKQAKAQADEKKREREEVANQAGPAGIAPLDARSRTGPTSFGTFSAGAIGFLGGGGMGPQQRAAKAAEDNLAETKLVKQVLQANLELLRGFVPVVVE